jgi:hypothetical protein
MHNTNRRSGPDNPLQRIYHANWAQMSLSDFLR